MTAPGRRWRKWACRSDGAAVVEFALIAPVLVLLYLGGYEAAQAISTFRKLTDATAQLANIEASEPTTSSAARIQSAMAASTQVMSPFDTTRLSIAVTAIQTDASGAATVTWSQRYQGGAVHPKAAIWILPAALATPNTAYIYVETQYQYNTTLGASYFGNLIPMADKLYMSPRNGPAINCSDC